MRVARTEDLAACHAIRRAVFIEEQGVSEAEEIDGKDASCLHYLCFAKDRAIATLRVSLQGQTAKIQRVATLKEARGTGAGATLMRAVHKDLAAKGVTEARLGSQISALGFYEKLGYRAFGPEFDDAGIPHRMMSRILP